MSPFFYLKYEQPDNNNAYKALLSTPVKFRSASLYAFLYKLKILRHHFSF